MNLLFETEREIRESNHTPEDIVFIGSIESGHCCVRPYFFNSNHKE